MKKRPSLLTIAVIQQLKFIVLVSARSLLLVNVSITSLAQKLKLLEDIETGEEPVHNEYRSFTDAGNFVIGISCTTIPYGIQIYGARREQFARHKRWMFGARSTYHALADCAHPNKIETHHVIKH